MQPGTVAEHPRLLFSVLDALRAGRHRPDDRRAPITGRARPRQGPAGTSPGISGIRDRLRLCHVAAMAGLEPKPAASRPKLWLGRLIAIVAIAAAVGLGAYALERLDRRPRTHDAFLYADTAGLAPDVGGRIWALPSATTSALPPATCWSR